MDTEIKELVKELVKEGITKKDAYYIAVLMQKNDIAREANKILGYCFGLNGEGPAYLEAIAMTLGYGTTGCQIADAINQVAEAINTTDNADVSHSLDDISTSLDKVADAIGEKSEA